MEKELVFKTIKEKNTQDFEKILQSDYDIFQVYELSSNSIESPINKMVIEDNVDFLKKVLEDKKSKEITKILLQHEVYLTCAEHNSYSILEFLLQNKLYKKDLFYKRMVQIIFEFDPYRYRFDSIGQQKMIELLYQYNNLTSNSLLELSKELQKTEREVLNGLSSQSLIWLMNRGFEFNREDILFYLCSRRLVGEDFLKDFVEQLKEYGFSYSLVEILGCSLNNPTDFFKLIISPDLVSKNQKEIKEEILKRGVIYSTIYMFLLQNNFDFLQGDYSLIPILGINFFIKNKIISDEQKNEIMKINMKKSQ